MVEKKKLAIKDQSENQTKGKRVFLNFIRKKLSKYRKSGYLWYCIAGLWNTVCLNEKGYLFNSSCEKKLQ